MHSRRGHALLPQSLLPQSLLLISIALAALPCHASLGRAPSDFGNTSVRHARALAASTPQARAASWDVNVSLLDNGTTVREYVAGGVVFAVAWNGPFLPDLRTLLGPHFDTLTGEAARRPRGGHGQVRIRQPDLNIESTGHMRAYAGRAWVNSLLPAGFDTDDIE